MVDCGTMNNCAIVLPTENDKWLTFSNYSRKERVPFIVYTDLECILEKMQPEDKDSYAYQHHEVFSIGYYVHCAYDSSLSTYRFYRDPDCITWLVKELEKLAHHVKATLSDNVPMETLSNQQ